jgi:hypothetical protein
MFWEKLTERYRAAAVWNRWEGQEGVACRGCLRWTSLLVGNQRWPRMELRRYLGVRLRLRRDFPQNGVEELKAIRRRQLGRR